MKRSFPLSILVLWCVLSPSLRATPVLVSQRDASIPAPAGGNGDSGTPLLSAGGRYVLFSSAANNLTTNGATFPARLNLYRRDLTDNSTELISVSTAGTPSNGDSFPGGISADGRYVAFESTATNLVANDTNGASDIFLRDTSSGTTLLLSKSTSGVLGNGVSRSPVITPDGRYIAFVSEATNLVANDTNGLSDIFVSDTQLGTTVLASVGAKSKTAATPLPGSDCPEISDDGRYVSFFSQATNLVSQPVSTTGDVYVRDLLANATYWASTNALTLFQNTLGGANIVSCNPALSANGQYLAFEVCTNLPTTNTSPGLILRYKIATGATDLVYTNANIPTAFFANLHNLSITPDGQFIAFLANAGTNTSIQLWSALTGTNLLLTPSLGTSVPAVGKCDYPVVSTNGHFVAFRSSATHLSLTPVSATNHVYVRDVQNSTTTVADIDTNNLGAGVPVLSVPALSDDGHVVAFESGDSSLVTNDSNGSVDVFARDLTAQTTTLVSAHATGYASYSGNNYTPLSLFSVSSNGFLVAFSSDATDIVLNDTNGERDVFVRDLSLGSNTLVSVGLGGAQSSSASLEPSLSGSGRYVAFSSFATNLVAGDTNSSEDIFLRDLQTHTTTLVSRGVYQGNRDSYQPIVSSDGRFVLYRSLATNLAAGSFIANFENFFLRDTQLGTNYALTVGSTGNNVLTASMTPDGHFVAFAGLIPGQAANKIYVWDSLAAALIYTNSTSGLLPSQLTISPDGSKFAYVISPSIFVTDIGAKTTTSLGASGLVRLPNFHFSQDSAYLAYTAGTPANVYRRTLSAGTNLLAASAVTSGLGSAGMVDLSPDGRFIAYASTTSTNGIPDANGASDIFLFDCSNGSTLLLSQSKAALTTANGSSIRAVFSPDGKFVFYQSRASDLTLNDFNQSLPDIYALHLASSPLVDSDNDGLDDAWEMANFHTLSHDGSVDTDGDGFSDLAEYQSGTDPNDPASYLHVELTADPSGNTQLQWPATLLPFYHVQYKNALDDSAWQELAGKISFLGPWASQTDTNLQTQRFYRVILGN